MFGERRRFMLSRIKADLCSWLVLLRIYRRLTESPLIAIASLLIYNSTWDFTWHRCRPSLCVVLHDQLLSGGKSAFSFLNMNSCIFTYFLSFFFDFSHSLDSLRNVWVCTKRAGLTFLLPVSQYCCTCLGGTNCSLISAIVLEQQV